MCNSAHSLIPVLCCVRLGYAHDSRWGVIMFTLSWTTELVSFCSTALIITRSSHFVACHEYVVVLFVPLQYFLRCLLCRSVSFVAWFRRFCDLWVFLCGNSSRLVYCNQWLLRFYYSLCHTTMWLTFFSFRVFVQGGLPITRHRISLVKTWTVKVTVGFVPSQHSTTITVPFFDSLFQFQQALGSRGKS